MKTSTLHINDSLFDFQEDVLELELIQEDFLTIIANFNKLVLSDGVRVHISYSEGNVYFFGEKTDLTGIRRQIEDVLLTESY